MSHQVATQMDLLPSLAELAGAQIPPSLVLDGRSLAEVLRGRRRESSDQAVYFYRGNTLYALRWEQYKVESREPPPPRPTQSELSRLISGPGQLQWRN